MNFKLLTAAAVLSTAIVGPALAQEPAPRAHSRQVQDQRVYHSQYYRAEGYRDYRGSGFWPADVAAGVVGGAIGTAGAIATAPFHDTYAYNGPYGYNGYDSGFVCQPGTMFIGSDGHRHICQ